MMMESFKPGPFNPARAYGQARSIEGTGVGAGNERGAVGVLVAGGERIAGGALHQARAAERVRLRSDAQRSVAFELAIARIVALAIAVRLIEDGVAARV